MKKIFRTSLAIAVIMFFSACIKEQFYEDNSQFQLVLTNGVWTIDEHYVIPDPETPLKSDTKKKYKISRSFKYAKIYYNDGTYTTYLSTKSDNPVNPDLIDRNDFIVKKSNRDTFYNFIKRDIFISNWKFKNDSLFWWDEDINENDIYHTSDTVSSYIIYQYSDNYIYCKKNYVKRIWDYDAAIFDGDTLIIPYNDIEFSEFYRLKNVKNKVIIP